MKTVRTTAKGPLRFMFFSLIHEAWSADGESLISRKKNRLSRTVSASEDGGRSISYIFNCTPRCLPDALSSKIRTVRRRRPALKAQPRSTARGIII